MVSKAEILNQIDKLIEGLPPDRDIRLCPQSVSSLSVEKILYLSEIKPSSPGDTQPRTLR